MATKKCRRHHAWASAITDAPQMLDAQLMLNSTIIPHLIFSLLSKRELPMLFTCGYYRMLKENRITILHDCRLDIYIYISG